MDEIAKFSKNINKISELHTESYEFFRFNEVT